MFESQVRIKVVGVCIWLGCANVWRFTVVAGANAAFDRVLWQLGLTAANQCTSFSAYVLADLDRTGRVAQPVDMAGSEDSHYLVNQRHNLRRTNARLAWDGIVRSYAGPAKPYGCADDDCLPLYLRHRSANGSGAYWVCCGLAFQRPNTFGTYSQLHCSRIGHSGSELSPRL